ncbi:MAG: patatin-like phospholipase family protein [Burkholderiaceae bacterium]
MDAAPVNLALQGGGSHGAFTWGVLDALLADGRLHIEGISGASAGAVNAVALASGWAAGLAGKRDPREAARESLERMWREIANLGALNSAQQKFMSTLWGGLPPELAPANIWANAMRGLFSPYQTNPLDINPLRKLLEREIDFEAIGRGGAPKVFVSATLVNTGKAEIFAGRKVTAQAVMASACLPMMFQAVEIDGKAYWDGGYSVNPAMTPLIDQCGASDIVLVQINPLRRDHTPQTPAEIADRVNELTFNASLLTQMRAIDFINRLIEDGWLQGSHCRTIRLHRIDGGEGIAGFAASSRISTDAQLLEKLSAMGRAAGERWLKKHFADVGVNSTVNIRRDYLDDTRLEGFARPPPEQPERKRLKPLWKRLFRKASR